VLYTAAIERLLLANSEKNSDAGDDRIEGLAKLYSNRSLARYRLEDLPGALLDADETIRVAPHWEKGYIRKGLALNKLGAGLQDILANYELGASLAKPPSTVLTEAARGVKLKLDPIIAADSSVIADKKLPQSKVGDRLTWDEETLKKHEAERGVLYARMKIDQPDTPFLVYDKEKAEQNMIGTVANRDAEPQFVDIDDLQKKLGLLEVQQEKGDSIVGDKSATPFERQRTNLYKGEGEVFKETHSS